MNLFRLHTPLVAATLAVAVAVAGCGSAAPSAGPDLPAGRPLATLSSTHPSVAHWTLYSTTAGLAVYGVGADGAVAAQTHLVGAKSSYAAVRAIYPERAALAVDAKGKVLENTLATSTQARDFVAAMQKDVATAEQNGVAYGCAGDAVTAVGGCLAAAGCGLADVEMADIACIGTFIACGGSLVALCEDCGICNVGGGRNPSCDDYDYANSHCTECYSEQQCCWGKDTCD